MARQNLTEAGAHTRILEARSDGSYLIQVISPGWGSSGYYAAEVLEAAGKAKVWPAGTHCYFDHPSAAESSDRPERSVKDIAATLTEDARWDSTRNALIARVEPVGLGKTVLADEAFRKAVGVSVRAAADIGIGEAEGRKGAIVQEIFPDTFNSVDIVTHAGRGGMILEAARRTEFFEASANDTERAIQDAVSAAYADSENDTYAWMRDYDPEQGVAYFEVSTGGKCATYQQAYSVDDNGETTLSGDRTEVQVRTQYVPVGEARTVELTREAALGAVREARNVGQWIESRLHLTLTQLADDMYGDGRLTREERISLSSAVGDALDAFTANLTKSAPQLFQRDLWADPDALATAAEAATPNVPVSNPAGQSTTTRENTMPENEGATTPIEESKRRELEEKAGRVPVLEAKLASETERADKAEQDLAVEKAKEYARDFGTKRVREANSELDPAAVEKIVAEAMREIPLTEADKAADRRLDTEVFGKRVDDAQKAEETYLATVIKNRGGSVQGLGQTDPKTDVTEAQVDNIVAGAFGRKTVKEA